MFVWSPQLSIMTRRTNVHALGSHRLPPFIRCCTYDGPPHYSIESEGNPHVRDSISRMLSELSTQMLRSEHKIISRFVGVFKHDRDGQLWLLCPISIRIENDELIGTSVVRDPVELNAMQSHMMTACPDEVIERALAMSVAMDSQSRRPRFAEVSRLHSQEVDSRLLKRRDTKMILEDSEKWRSPAEGPGVPNEMSVLRHFIDDTLYTLYATRMTTNAAVRHHTAVVTLPLQLQNFLGGTASDRLMRAILGLVQVVPERVNTLPVALSPDSCGGSTAGESLATPSGEQYPNSQRSAKLTYRVDDAAPSRPLNVVLRECESFMDNLKASFLSRD
jgi:hypothetical protein